MLFRSTGKTYSVAALVARALAEDDSLRIANIVITTYTRNAAAELKDRIRRRLADTTAALALPDGHRDPGDVVLATLAGTALLLGMGGMLAMRRQPRPPLRPNAWWIG